MLDVAQPLMAAAPRFVSALLSGFAAPAPHPTIRGFAAYFNAYGPTRLLPPPYTGALELS